MQVELTQEIVNKVDKASEILGIRKQELIDRAVIVYLDAISKLLDLKKELKEWDLLSDEALIDFEKSL